MSENYDNIEKQLADLNKLSTKIDLQTAHTKEKVEALEKDFRALSHDINRVNTELEIVKKDNHYPFLQAEIDKLQLDLAHIKTRQSQYEILFQEVRIRAEDNSSKWFKLFDGLYQFFFAVIVAYILWKIGIKP